MLDATPSDSSWRLPNRRFIDTGLYLPSLHSEGIESFAFFMDTSWSLTDATLDLLRSAIRTIAAEIQPDTVIVLQIDVAVRDAKEYPAVRRPNEIALKGRGATDFRPGLEWRSRRPQPAYLLRLPDRPGA